jgi:hypothetical protein
MDCDFGLNESDENMTITDNSMEPDAGETKRVNMLIQSHMQNKQRLKDNLRMEKDSDVSKDEQKFLQKTPDKVSLFNSIETKVQ